jgi:two-component system, NarL family, response regulator NreC
MSISILLADDHKIIRDGLRSLLDRQPKIEVIGEADNGRQAVQLARELTPDVVVMDISMPELNGMDATRQILADSPHIKIIALSMHTDKRFIIKMLQAGASGYLLKDCAFDELARAVSTVLAGQTYLSPEITTVVIKDLVQETENSDSSLISQLSSREREVLQLLAEGKTTKQIAGELFISSKTVETHRTNIMKKLNIHTLADLVKLAVREGLTSL